MNTTKYSQLKNITIIALVICNLVCIWFLAGKPTFTDPKPLDKDAWFIENVLKKKLNLDDQQVVDFMTFKKEHEGEVHERMRRMHELRKDLFDNLGNEGYDLSAQIKLTGQLQSELDSMAYAHFNNLRSICRPEQYEAFDNGVRHIMLRGRGPGRRGNRK